MCSRGMSPSLTDAARATIKERIAVKTGERGNFPCFPLMKPSPRRAEKGENTATESGETGSGREVGRCASAMRRRPCCAGISRWAPTRQSRPPRRTASRRRRPPRRPRRRRHPLRSRPARPPPAPPAALLDSPAEAAQSARLLAAAADTVEALAAAVARFEGCPLKRTATNTVFIDGNPQAPVMIIGEGPGAEEDRTGRPFVGRAGQLLDRMLAAIGLDRTQVLITNVVYWRPPGNRTPTAAEIAACLPFVLRLIALVKPKVLVLCGGTAAGALLPQGGGITRLRGRW